jgi:hypothetical protein
MILRRLAQNLKQQNWTAIWIEFVLLVAGVFLGIQVSNWNAAQADARLGQDYVQRLIRDLHQDQAAIRAQRDYYTEVLKSLQVTDELLRSVDSDSRTLVVNAYRATEVIYIPTTRATWDQIVSSGHLGLLPVGAVEAGLSQYYAFDIAQDSYRNGMDSSYRQTVRKIIPLSMQIAMRAGCSDTHDKRGNPVGFEKECKFDADPAALKEVAGSLRNNPAVAADLRYQYSFVVSTVINLGGTSRTIDDALSAFGTGPGMAEEASP